MPYKARELLAKSLHFSNDQIVSTLKSPEVRLWDVRGSTGPYLGLRVNDGLLGSNPPDMLIENLISPFRNHEVVTHMETSLVLMKTWKLTTSRTDPFRHSAKVVIRHFPGASRVFLMA